MMQCLSGDDLGVFRTDAYFVCEWVEDEKRVVFSFARLGNGLTAHFAARKESLRRLKDAINEFCQWAFDTYQWCEMIFAIVERKSLERLVKKCGFVKVDENPDQVAYARFRQ